MPDGADRVEEFSAAVLAIWREHDPDTVLQTIVDRVRALARARYAGLGIPSESGDGLERFVTSGLANVEIAGIERSPRGLGLLGAVLRAGRSIVVPDIAVDARSSGIPPSHPRMTSLLGVPIRRDGAVMAVLYLTDKVNGERFAESDRELVERFAVHAAEAIAAARFIDALEQSEERYRLLIEAAPEIVLALDRIGRIVFVNDRARAITGFERDRIEGRLLREVVTPEDQPVVDLHLRALRGGAERVTYAVSAPDAFGSLRHFVVSLVPVADGGFQGIARDVTEQQALSREIAERTGEVLAMRDERQRLREFVSLVIQAQEEERSRIAGDLHDTTVQTLTAIGRRLHSLAATSGDPAAMREELSMLARAAMAEAEEVRRLSRNLRPSVLDHLGLAAGLEEVAADLRSTGVSVSLRVDGSAGRLDDQQRTALFRIAQEALTNVRRHSEARHVAVHLAVGDQNVELTIGDDGRGFDADDAEGTRAQGSARHLGIAGMRERAAMLGGWLAIESAPGAGTRVTARLPLDR